jgi:hypothetical protein
LRYELKPERNLSQDKEGNFIDIYTCQRKRLSFDCIVPSWKYRDGRPIGWQIILLRHNPGARFAQSLHR